MQYLVANSWGARMLLWKWDLLEAGGHAAGKYFGVRSLRDLLGHGLPTFFFPFCTAGVPLNPAALLGWLVKVFPLCWGCDCRALALFALYNPRYALCLHVCVHGSLLTLWEIRTAFCFLWAPKWSSHCGCFGADALTPGENPWTALKG